MKTLSTFLYIHRLISKQRKVIMCNNFHFTCPFRFCRISLKHLSQKLTLMARYDEIHELGISKN